MDDIQGSILFFFASSSSPLPSLSFFSLRTMSNPDYEKDLGFEDKDLSDTNVVTKGAPREFGQIDEGMQEGTDLHR